MDLAAMVVQSRAARQITECVLHAISCIPASVFQFGVIRCGLTTAISEWTSDIRIVPKSLDSFAVLHSTNPEHLVHLSITMFALQHKGAMG
jgi:hypothetical protein